VRASVVVAVVGQCAPASFVLVLNGEQLTNMGYQSNQTAGIYLDGADVLVDADDLLGIFVQIEFYLDILQA
jgi:hypothetical protein